MSKIPPHSGKEMVAALRKAGFEDEPGKGDHTRMIKRGLARPVIVPMWDELPDFIVSNNLRTAGISRKDYLVLLGLRRKH